MFIVSFKNISKKSKTDFFEEELTEGRLFPDFLSGSTASATESTGLISVGNYSAPDLNEVYDDVYSYRQKKAVGNQKRH